MKYDENKWLISASTPGEDLWTESKGPDKNEGLVAGHAYSVISVKEVHGNQLMNLRNPWGSFEWDGEWGDKSGLWDS